MNGRIKKKKFMRFKRRQCLQLVGIAIAVLIAWAVTNFNVPQSDKSIADTFDVNGIPLYSGQAYVEINNNIPFFEDEDLTTVSYEYYSELDSKGRCGVCSASVGQDIMPTQEREAIGMIKPSGWQYSKYPEIVEGNYLYNRCHLLGFQLTGENANEKNLITGTRYMNTKGMLPFENKVADYVRESGNHVMLRVTPIFEGENMLASGVLMEAKSVEDEGKGVLFCIYAYNVQPGITIDYATGENEVAKTASEKRKDESVDTITVWNWGLE